MLEIYTAATTNGQRATLAALESGLPHRIHFLNMREREHKGPAYLAINPNGTVPGMVDTDGPGGKTIALTQSIAIVEYIAEKAGRFLPKDPALRLEAKEWMLFCATDLYPPFASIYFMTWAKPPHNAAAEIFRDRMLARFERFDSHLANRTFVVGDEYSIADIAIYPMCVMATKDMPGVDGFANLQRWMKTIAARPKVAEAMGMFQGTGPQLARA